MILLFFFYQIVVMYLQILNFGKHKLLVQRSW